MEQNSKVPSTNIFSQVHKNSKFVFVEKHIIFKILSFINNIFSPLYALIVLVSKSVKAACTSGKFFGNGGNVFLRER